MGCNFVQAVSIIEAEDAAQALNAALATVIRHGCADLLCGHHTREHSSCGDQSESPSPATAAGVICAEVGAIASREYG
jgi:hypothetical protein